MSSWLSSFFGPPAIIPSEPLTSSCDFPLASSSGLADAIVPASTDSSLLPAAQETCGSGAWLVVTKRPGAPLPSADQEDFLLVNKEPSARGRAAKGGGGGAATTRMDAGKEEGEDEVVEEDEEDEEEEEEPQQSPKSSMTATATAGSSASASLGSFSSSSPSSITVSTGVPAGAGSASTSGNAPRQFASGFAAPDASAGASNLFIEAIDTKMPGMLLLSAFIVEGKPKATKKAKKRKASKRN